MIVDITSAICQAATGIMGFWFASQQQDRRVKWAYGTIAVLGLALNIIGTIQNEKQENRRQSDEHGGELVHFSVLTAGDPSQPRELHAIPDGNIPVYGVRIRVRRSPENGATLEDVRKIVEEGDVQPWTDLGDLPAESVDPTKVILTPGSYQIDVTLKHGLMIHEMLRFGPYDGKFGQTYVVTDWSFNKSLSSYTSPGYVPNTWIPPR
ncbi:MAG: hypothetical protein EPO08_16455 [Rhodospirillaceae bacterium]|nr:MAG: hypothetical protein EPO08_16455 [Rhodospirillaceae bacterium]